MQSRASGNGRLFNARKRRSLDFGTITAISTKKLVHMELFIDYSRSDCVVAILILTARRRLGLLLHFSWLDYESSGVSE
jgi:hypothetical protein